MRSAVIWLLRFKVVASLLEFEDTYTLKNDHYHQNRTIVGFEPDGISAGLPVFVWVMGTGDVFDAPVQDSWIQAMTNRGFISARVDYPNSMDGIFGGGFAYDCVIHLNCFSGFKEKASLIPEVLSKLCARPRASCSAGIALAGHGQGSFITQYALAYDRRITAILSLSNGCLMGQFPNELTNAEISKLLPVSKRLYISGSDDYEKTGGIDHQCLNKVTNDTTFIRLVPDGHFFFYGTCDPAIVTTKMKCQYALSNETWGFKSALDWLAQEASPTKAIISLQDEYVDCDDAPIGRNIACGHPPWVFIGFMVALVCCSFFCCSMILVCCILRRKTDHPHELLRDDEDWTHAVAPALICGYGCCPIKR